MGGRRAAPPKFVGRARRAPGCLDARLDARHVVRDPTDGAGQRAIPESARTFDPRHAIPAVVPPLLATASGIAREAAHRAAWLDPAEPYLPVPQALSARCARSARRRDRVVAVLGRYARRRGLSRTCRRCSRRRGARAPARERPGQRIASGWCAKLCDAAVALAAERPLITVASTISTAGDLRPSICRGAGNCTPSRRASSSLAT